MSWSFALIGTPAAIVQQLGRIESGLTGMSLEEFKEARPSIEALVGLNSNQVNPPTLQINASGHASATGGVKTYSQCAVHLRSLDATLAKEEPAAVPASAG
jgi:hypothetical protein